jgi:hypothetical protein
MEYWQRCAHAQRLLIAHILLWRDLRAASKGSKVVHPQAFFAHSALLLSFPELLLRCVNVADGSYGN